MIVSAGVLSLCMTVSCVCVYVLCIECAYEYACVVNM